MPNRELEKVRELLSHGISIPDVPKDDSIRRVITLKQINPEDATVEELVVAEEILETHRYPQDHYSAPGKADEAARINKYVFGAPLVVTAVAGMVAGGVFLAQRNVVAAVASFTLGVAAGVKAVRPLKIAREIEENIPSIQEDVVARDKYLLNAVRTNKAQKQSQIMSHNSTSNNGMHPA